MKYEKRDSVESALLAGRIKRSSKIFLHNAFIALLCVIWLIPIVWLVCTSFSAYPGMNTSTFFPKEWSAIHYTKLLTPDTVNWSDQLMAIFGWTNPEQAAVYTRTASRAKMAAMGVGMLQPGTEEEEVILRPHINSRSRRTAPSRSLPVASL